MGQRYNEQTKRMEYVQDPISAQLPDVKAAAQYGYHSFSRGTDGSIESAIDPSTGRRVPFVNGQPPEMARTAAASNASPALRTSTGGPISSADVALNHPTGAQAALSRVGAPPSAGGAGTTQTGSTQAGGTAPNAAGTNISTSPALPMFRGFDAPHVATPGSTSTMFTAQGPVQVPTGSSISAMPGNRSLLSTGNQAQVVGGPTISGGPANAMAERSRTVGPDGTTHIVSANGGTVDIPASSPGAPGGTGTPTGIFNAGQEIVRNGQGQLAPGALPSAPTAPVSAAPTAMAAAGMPTLPAPNFGPVPTSPQNFQAPTFQGFDKPPLALNTGAATPSAAVAPANALTAAASKPIGSSVPVMASSDFAVPRAGATPSQAQTALAAVDSAGTLSFTPPTGSGSVLRSLTDAFTTGATNATTQPVTSPLPSAPIRAAAGAFADGASNANAQPVTQPLPSQSPQEDAVQQTAIDRNARLGRPTATGASSSSTPGATSPAAPAADAAPKFDLTSTAQSAGSPLFQGWDKPLGTLATDPTANSPAAPTSTPPASTRFTPPPDTTAMANAKFAQGYVKVDGGWDGVPVSGTDATGQRVDFTNGPSTPAGQALNKSTDAQQTLNAAPSAQQALNKPTGASSTLAQAPSPFSEGSTAFKPATTAANTGAGSLSLDSTNPFAGSTKLDLGTGSTGAAGTNPFLNAAAAGKNPFSPNDPAAGGVGGAGTPAAPVVDPDELRRRQMAATAANNIL